MGTIVRAWKVTKPNRTTRNGFQWPEEGEVSLPDGEYDTHNKPCGRGLHLAKTFFGAAFGSYPATTAFVVEYDTDDVLGEDQDKVRVRRCRVVEPLDIPRLIRDGWFAGADMFGADLRGADLSRANLEGADLRGADLRGGTCLTGADLRRADLRGACLTGADLRRADLRGALLTGADLRRTDLRGALLTGAGLRRTDLRGANLTG